jgi:hypothetical protein
VISTPKTVKPPASAGGSFFDGPVCLLAEPGGVGLARLRKRRRPPAPQGAGPSGQAIGDPRALDDQTERRTDLR